LIEIGPLVLEKILQYFLVFLLFRYYLPLEKSTALHLKKFETPTPQPPGWFVPNLVEIGPMVLEKSKM
jgi:hypothetical protein